MTAEEALKHLSNGYTNGEVQWIEAMNLVQNALKRLRHYENYSYLGRENLAKLAVIGDEQIEQQKKGA